VKKKIIWFIILIAVILPIYFLLNYQGKKDMSIGSMINPDVAVFSFTETLIQDGKKKGKLTADAGYKNNTTGKVIITFPILEYYQKSGKFTTLTSLEAEWDSNKQIIKALRNVVVSDTDGFKITTPELIWNTAQNRMYTDTNITLQRGTSIVKGSSFVGMTDDKMFTLKNATGRIVLNDLKGKNYE